VGSANLLKRLVPTGALPHSLQKHQIDMDAAKRGTHLMLPPTDRYFIMLLF